MRIISLLITLVAFGVGVFFMYGRYERYQQNQRIEAQNHRKNDANRVIKLINSFDGRSRECTDWFVGLASGSFDLPTTTPRNALMFSESCGESMVERADEASDLVNRLAAKEETQPGRTEFLTEARALIEAYRSQSDDFSQAYRILNAAPDQDARSALRPQVAQLVNRAIPAINRGLGNVESARKAFIYPNS